MHIIKCKWNTCLVEEFLLSYNQSPHEFWCQTSEGYKSQTTTAQIAKATKWGWPETKEESFATRTSNSNRISVEIQKAIVRSNAGKTNEERVCDFSSLFPLLFALPPSFFPFSLRDREDYAPAFAQLCSRSSLFNWNDWNKFETIETIWNKFGTVSDICRLGPDQKFFFLKLTLKSASNHPSSVIHFIWNWIPYLLIYFLFHFMRFSTIKRSWTRLLCPPPCCQLVFLRWPVFLLPFFYFNYLNSLG